MIVVQNTHPNKSASISKNAQVPKPKKLNSSKSLTTPGIGTGALPERLLSPGTANTAQIIIMDIGKPKPKRYDPSAQ
jgi:hypothetical protein